MHTIDQPVEIGSQDLPLHCPVGKTKSWNMHPRVFLDITHTGQAKCPYCGTLYLLKPGTKVGH
ncbi:MAG: hypothetical protein RIR83_374 [Pseudomonadota bacterium]|jgi:uncharacterized Zn-finger protein